MVTTVKLKKQSQADDIVDLYNALAAVGSYINAIDLYEFEIPSPTPKWFWEFENEIAKLKGHVGRWNTVIAKYLSGVPQVILAMDDLIDQDFDDLRDLINQLIDDPENFDLRQKLKKKLERTIEEFADIDGNVHALLGELQEFSQNIQGALDSFNHFTIEILNQEEKEREKIDNLQKTIEDLQVLIKSKEKRITRDEIIAGAGFLIMVVGFLMLLPPATPLGLYVAGCGVVVTNLALLDIILANEDIQKLQQQVRSCADEISKENQLIASLAALSTSFTPLIEKASKAEDAMDVFINIWTGIDDQLHYIMDQIEKTSPDDLKEALKTIDDIQSIWEDIVDLANFLKSIDYKVHKDVYWIQKPKG